MSRSPFPLSWPDGWARAKWRQHSSFEKRRGFNAARDGALRELRLMRGVSHIVITSNLPTNSKGLPHSASSGSLSDPGIAVWWVKGGKEQVMACDRWCTAVENMHAVELSIAAIRGINRWGATEMVERAFAGFAALPPGDGSYTEPPQSAKRSWRYVFDIATNLHDVLSKEDILALVKARYRDRMKTAHPDVGGDAALARELTGAMREAEEELA